MRVEHSSHMSTALTLAAWLHLRTQLLLKRLLRLLGGRWVS